MSSSLRPYGLQPARLLCPWDSSGMDTLLQGIFMTQGLNPHLLCLLHWQVGSLPLAPPGKHLQFWQWLPNLFMPIYSFMPAVLDRVPHAL